MFEFTAAEATSTSTVDEDNYLPGWALPQQKRGQHSSGAQLNFIKNLFTQGEWTG